ncbi:MAG: hypothetical protein QW531_00965 [Thermoplasmata archaeon]
MNEKELTVSELALIYDKEKKSKILTKVRKDFYKASMECIQKLRERYQKELAANPDSKSTEMARREYERARKDLENTVHMRTIKILKQSLDHYLHPDPEFQNSLTEEEKRFLEGIMAVIAQFVANVWLWDKSLQTRPVIQPPPVKAMEITGPASPMMKTLPQPEKLEGIKKSEKKNLVVVFLTESSIALPEKDLFYRKGDIAALPEKIARVLVNGKKASLIYPM